MGRPKGVPSYRLHRASGQAVVTLNGRDIYLGEHGSPESKESYRRALAAWFARNDRDDARRPTITELSLRRAAWASTWYAPCARGRSPTAHSLRRALAMLRDHYGNESVDMFTPVKLKALRDAMIERGWSRPTINARVRMIVAMFRDAAPDGLVDPAVVSGLQTLAPLRKGRSKAIEHDPVTAVPMESVEATIAACHTRLGSMIRVLLLTGMRPGEACSMTPDQIDRSTDRWLYRPTRHKTAHKGRTRIIPLGPKCRAILAPIIASRRPDEPVFQPRDAKPRSRRTRFTTDALGRMIKEACKRAGVEPWSPNQLRHTAATELRRMAGIEAARVALGHADAGTTEIYAERDLAAIQDTMERYG